LDGGLAVLDRSKDEQELSDLPSLSSSCLRSDVDCRFVIDLASPTEPPAGSPS
jgi:hypothetical protein